METYFTVVKGFIATGILYIPKAFVDGGWVYSSFAMLLAGLLSAHCATLLLDARRKIGAKSYSDLGLITFGWQGKALIDVMLASSQIGFTIAYIYFIVENLTPIFFAPE